MRAPRKTAARHAFALILGCVLLASLAAQPTRLHLPAATGTVEEVREALEAGADFNDHDYSGVTALMAAAPTNHDPGAVLVLLRYGAVVDARDRNGETALMRAAARNADPAVASALLRAGANANARDSRGLSPLLYAAWVGRNPDIAVAALAAGADAKARGRTGRTLLECAEDNPALRGDTQILRQPRKAMEDARASAGRAPVGAAGEKEVEG